MEHKSLRSGDQLMGSAYRFEFSGGAAALDFINTLDERPRGGRELLTSYDRLLEWSLQAKLATESKVARIGVYGRGDPSAADRALSDALALREAMFLLLRAYLADKVPTKGQLSELNRWARKANKKTLMIWEEDRIAWQTYSEFDHLDFMLPDLAISLAELLVCTDTRQALRLCAAPDCDWAFLDRSRRANRIWCDMSVCGNRAKAKRHHQRSRSAKPALSPGAL
jgi:predicted RNA-binding Zn ribbon-like protein